MYYTSSNSDKLGTSSYVHHGLGSESKNGEWISIERNLEVLEEDDSNRDVHYYTRALCYLGLAKFDSSSRDICLSYNGERFFQSDEDAKKDIILEILNTDPIVSKYLKGELDLSHPDHKKEFELRGISSSSTIARRLSSLKAWIAYLAE